MIKKLYRLQDVLDYQYEQRENQKAFNFESDNHWVSRSSQNLLEEKEKSADFLMWKGVLPKDNVLIIPDMASPKIVLFDLAIQSIGAISVFAHRSASSQQIHHIVKESKPTIILIFEDSQKDLLETLDVSCDRIINVETQNLSDFPKNTNKPQINNSDPDSLSTIIYTSGTTGIPKGVMLSHKNILSNVSALVGLMPLHKKERVISFLPYSHVFERTCILAYLTAGVSIHFVKDRSKLPYYLKTTKPHFFTAVPRFIEKIYQEGFTNRKRKNPVSRIVVSWAVNIGRKPRKSVFQSMPLFFAKMLVLRKLKKALGGSLKAVFVGAAHLNPSLGRLFSASGILLKEGYGMSETSPVITVNRFTRGLSKLGTVGPPIPNVEVKIDDPNENGEGEILVKGPNVMLGYYKNQALTKSAFENDWFKTGDIGKWVNKRFLKITDRKKDIFKTSSGKYIAPQSIQNHFKTSRLIDRILVLGFQRPYPAALILPDFNQLQNWADHQNIHWTSPKYMILNIQIKKLLQQEVDRLNTYLSTHEKIRRFIILGEDWTIENGLLSGTLKPIRGQIIDKYQKDIDKMYS